MSNERFTYEKQDKDIAMHNLPKDQSATTEEMANYSEKAYAISDNDEYKKEGSRRIVDEFVDNATTHGIPRVLNSSRPSHSRLFWCAVTLIFIGAFLYQGTMLIISFIGRPTSTKISLVTEPRLEFPAVTICNLNMLRRSKLKGTRFEKLAALDRDHKVDGIGLDDSDYNWFFSSSEVSPSPGGETATTDAGLSSPAGRRRRALSADYSHDSIDDEYNFDDFRQVDDPDDWDALYNISKTSDFSNFKNLVNPTAQEIRELGHRAKDFILQCAFDTEPCSFKNFSVIQNAEYGNCFVFNNAHKLRRRRRTTTSRTGSQYGLHLTLMVEQPEYVGVISPNSGVKVAINDPRIYAFPEDDGIAASPGFATSIGITKTSISRLDYPYGDCISEHASYYQPEKYDFSQRSCTKMCLQKNLQSECSCVTDLLVNDTLCQFNIDKQVNCRKRIFKAFLKNKLKCDCTNPCKEIVFKPRISVSRWPAARFEGHLYDRLSVINRKAARILTNGAQSRNNLVRLSVFFEELNFEQVTESPLITVESLFGGVGGLLGLYVGMSFISIIEILVFISELIRSFCCPGSYSSNKTKVSGR
ncbi:degenerin deg-1-like [Lytechinus variegatus]|uniref:degenerin deg-1-like n=1 Tax=Lytechinus variegatus TaxID=7654 RepID=UPI001BB21850|nr:degenerin deg-1-like [Lytechinus variegatus]